MTERNREPLSTAEERHLWVACGGICSFRECDKRLIMNTEGDLTNIGIKAHIIGHKGPRHEYMEEYGYSYETLETVSNLMLMCDEHHKLIDGSKTKHKYPPDVLFNMKEEHEKWVSSWSDSKKKKSIALVHKRMGGPLLDIECEGEAPFILLDAVEDQHEFNKFDKIGWEEGKKSNELLYKKFVSKIKEREAKVVEVFPLSPIPLLIHLGSLLTDTVPYFIYQYNRNSGLWVSSNSSEEEKIELHNEKILNESEELAVLISISGIVKPENVNETLEKNVDYVKFKISNPGLDSVLYKEDIIYIQRTLKREIENLLQLTDYKKIHLFYAGPAGLAIEIGRGINTNMWCEVCLYQFNNRQTPKYQYALTI